MEKNPNKSLEDFKVRELRTLAKQVKIRYYKMRKNVTYKSF